MQQRTISLEIPVKRHTATFTRICHLFIFEIPKNQIRSDQSHFLEIGTPEPSWLACVGMLVSAVRTPLHETTWQACSYLQGQEAKVLLSVKRNELAMTFLVTLYFMQF